jgi:hypothetical protein
MTATGFWRAKTGLRSNEFDRYFAVRFFLALAAMPNYVRYDDVREQIEDGSLLLFRGRGLFSRAIETAGRSPYSHAAMAGWVRRTQDNRGILMCVEVREKIGARAVNLSNQVLLFPGRIDVYRPTPGFRASCDVAGVVTEMFRLTGQAYDYASVLWSAFAYLLIFRWFMAPDFGRPTRAAGALDCSGTIAWAFDKVANVLLCPNTRHEHVTPGDLGRCPYFDYVFTLGVL